MGVELYMSSLVSFAVHDGLVTDFHEESIQFRNASELDAWIDPSGHWVQKELMPQVSKVLSIAFNAAAESNPDPEQRPLTDGVKDSFEESDGAFQFIAADFLITTG